MIACLDVRANDAGDLVVTKGDQYDVRETVGGKEVPAHAHDATETAGPKDQAEVEELHGCSLAEAPACLCDMFCGCST